MPKAVRAVAPKNGKEIEKVGRFYPFFALRRIRTVGPLGSNLCNCKGMLKILRHKRKEG
jgi:hypothetical protein